MLDRVYNFANFFDDDEKDFVKKSFKNHGQWELVGTSMGSVDIPNLDYLNSHRNFWYKDLIEHKGLTWVFKNKIETFLTKQIEVRTFYGNAQSHGQSGLPHVDAQPNQSGEFGSLVYFIHDNWLPEYGGHLLIKEVDEFISILPHSNSAVLFNSRLPHCPLEPTVYCRTQRESIALKFRIL